MRRTSLLFAILLSVPALGYELTGQDWTWQANPVDVPFEINTDSWTVTGLDIAEVASAYQNSAERWSEPLSGARVTAEYGGSTSSLDLDLDNVHIARYVDGAYPGATVALASVWSYTNGTGAGFNPWDIADCDIEFFGENDFGEILWSADTAGPGTLEMDIELVATHELGHCLGFNHSAEVDAVMYASAPPGSPPDWRDLDQDDLDGIYAMYGLPPSLSLSASSPTCDDGNGILEPGDVCSFDAVITDLSQIGTIGVDLELTSIPSDLKFTATSYTVGDLPATGSLTQQLDFEVDSGCTTSADVLLDYTLSDNNGRIWDSANGDVDGITLTLDCTPPPQLPDLVFSSLSSSEMSGNADGAFNPGETIRYDVFVENIGNGVAGNVIAESTSTSPDILITNSPVSVGDFNPGDLFSFYIDFDVDSNCTGNQSISLAVSLTESTGLNWNFDLPVELRCTQSPELVLDNDYFDDSIGGNGDGLIQEGETIIYTLQLNNAGQGNAEGAFVHTIEPSDADVSVLNSIPMDIGDLGPGDSYDLDFKLFIDPLCSGSRDTTVTVELDCGAGLSCETLFNVDVPLDCSTSGGGLVLGGSTYTEDDGDTLIEQGEGVSYEIQVSNLDSFDHTGVNANITSNDSDISVGTPVVLIGDILGAGDATLEMELKIDESCITSKSTPLTIELVDSAGDTWSHDFYVELSCSAIGSLVIESVEVNDSPVTGFTVGNGDGILQEGETGVQVNITLLNPTNSAIDSSPSPVLGYIVAQDSNFDPGSQQLEWGHLGPNESQMNTNGGEIDVYEDCSGTEALFDLEIYDKDNILSHTEEFSLEIDCDEDDDGSPASEDCDDLDGMRYPGNPEICDGVDNDCDSLIDDGITNTDTWYADSDGDTYGDAANTTEACTAPSGYVGDATDCDDTNPEISPGAAEICDEIDNDCTGFADDGLLLYSYYADTDEDGFGDIDTMIDICGPTEGYVEDSTDCDDTQYSVAPNRTELCDGLDNDCDEDIDEDCEADDDGDGWGASLDCDDDDASINPDADELCDGLDNNCDGDIDNQALDGSSYYTDGDGDGYGDPNSVVVACSLPAGTTTNSEDCNDANAAIKPGALELCDGIDDDCDGLIDDDCQTDNDGDGYSSLVDCDDDDSSVNPGVPEVCDGIDNDCDTIIDDDATNLQLYYLDEDGDGFGTGATEALGCEAPDGYVENYLDCDDSTADRSPDNAEICDGVDNNCDLLTDNEAVDAETWYTDTDGDGFGDPNNPIMACVVQPGAVSNNLDCDDTRSNVYPQAIETWYDGIDQNCDGIDDDQDQDGYLNAEECDDTDSTVFPGSGDFDEDCEPITTMVEHKSPSPRGGGGCATALPTAPALWWLAVALGFRRRQRLS